MTDRQVEILYAIIEEYAEMAAPVGSVTLAKLFDVSSATIRSEMAKLEEMGYIMQPHTSAGRVPTDAGYRMYVNSLQDEIDIEVEEIDGKPYVDRPTRALEVRIQSQTRADRAIRSAVDSLVDLTGNLGLATIGDQLYIAGLGNLFAQPEFLEQEKVQAVAKLLDNIEPWLREVMPNQAINVYIGAENPIGKASNVSLIISRFRSPYSDKSYIGILGPTRQSYQRVMSLVRRAGFVLEEIL
ncbi:MAG: transcriptional regulator [Candidatus Nomurabacteria bacterium]|jgi:heat-inducible transcriptional repressor|nr:transcriptional regulator [Candidatus Nomurabacteria bacterium]